MATVRGLVLGLDEAHARAEEHRRRGDRVVLTNGHFDLLHAGHVLYLEQARGLGDVLFVGLNSDASSSALKGPKRPLVPAAERALVLTCLRSVDYVVVFDGPTADSLIDAIRPHYYAKGSDYSLATLPEAEMARRTGAEVRLIPLTPGCSTTDLIERIVERYCR